MKRAGIPDAVTVCGESCPVRVVPSSQMEKDSDGRPLDGLSPAGSHDILLDGSLETPFMRRILRHEVGHRACELSGASYIIQRMTQTVAQAHELEEFLVRIWLPAYEAAVESMRRRKR